MNEYIFYIFLIQFKMHKNTPKTVSFDVFECFFSYILGYFELGSCFSCGRIRFNTIPAIAQRAVPDNVIGPN